MKVKDIGAHICNWRAGPPAALLATQIVLYLWMAPRGFDFTDESYYFLNYLHWRELVGTVTFFGAYFELPFRLLGQSVFLARILSLALLLVCSAFFSLAALNYCRRQASAANGRDWGMIAATMAASLFYFGYLGTLRAPSYNLLVLCSMLLSTGLLLRIANPRTPDVRSPFAMLFYGFVLGACALGKASSGVLLVVIHGFFFAFLGRSWPLRRVATFAGLAILGASLNAIALQGLHPDWLKALREGVNLAHLDGSHNLVRQINNFRWEIQSATPALLTILLGSAAIVSFAVRRLGSTRRNLLSAMVVALIAICSAGLILAPTNWWLPLTGAVALLLWTMGVVGRTPIRLTAGDLPYLALLGMLLALPLAFSFGTNMPLLEHSQMAAVFALAAILLGIIHVTEQGLLTLPGFTLCASLLCLPTLVIQLKAAVDVRHTYRQLSALAEQKLPAAIGSEANTLLVDSETHETLNALSEVRRATGMQPGQTILDLTGDGPGLVYVLQGRPIGLAWLLGGYSGSSAIAARIIELLPEETLRNAWLLSSDNNPRAIKGWQELLRSRLGPDSHELVASTDIRAPYRWDKKSPEKLSVLFFRPRIASN